MGRNKKNRKRIDSWKERTKEHENKIAKERSRINPDVGLIRHWQNEINGWKKEIDRRKKRLPGKK